LVLPDSLIYLRSLTVLLIVWSNRYSFLIIILNRLIYTLILQKLAFILGHNTLSLMNKQPIILIIGNLFLPLIIFSFIMTMIPWTLMKQVKVPNHVFLGQIPEWLDKLIVFNVFLVIVEKLTDSSLFWNEILSRRRKAV
jgi:putative Ca2+/H+ antiporter (TMEM165/GDT1 family)